jgi:hypothetical protein
MALQKNTAGKWVVFAFDITDNTAKTGDAAQITANVRIDGGAANAVDDTNPTELEDGYYIFDITAAECNGDQVLITPASSTSNIQVIGVPGSIWTSAPNYNLLGIESDGDLTKVNLCANTTLVDTVTTLPDVTLADAVTHGGTTALLRLGSSSATPAFYATNSGGPAVHYEATGTGTNAGNGLKVESNGTGVGQNDAALLAKATGSTAPVTCFVGADDSSTINTSGDWDVNITGALSTLTTYTGNTPQTSDHTAALTTAQTDLDTITGSDGVTLATAQGNYAPNTVVPMLGTLSQTEHDATQAAVAGILVDTGTTLPALIGTPAADLAADVAAVKVDTGNLVTRITSTLFAGITSLAEWLGLMAGDQAADATALAEIKTSGAGSGTYDSTTDSLEAIAGAGGGGAPTAAQVADAVWDETQSTHTTAGSFGEIATEVAAILTDTGTTIPATISTAQADLDTITDTDGVILGAAGVDSIWDEVITKAGHNVSNSAAKYLRLIKQTVSVTESAVDDAGASTTVFNTDLTEVDDFWNDALIVFTTGSLAGQSKPIQDFANTNGQITLDEALTSAPANNDEFIIASTHVHPISQIQSGLATEAKQDIIDTNVDSILTDTGTTIPATIATAQADLDTVTGADGVTLATSQGNYAPSTAADMATVLANQSTIAGYVDTEVADILARLTALQGAGFVEATDSNEAIRDRGDAAWTTGGGGGGGDATEANQTAIAAAIAALQGAGFVESTDSNEAIRNRGDSAWTGSGGGSSVVIGPIAATVNTNTVATTAGGTKRAISQYANSELAILVQVVDGNGDAFDIAGNEFELYSYDSDGADVFEVDSTNEPAQFATSESVASSGVFDQLTITVLPANVPDGSVGNHEYRLWDKTRDVVYLAGRFAIIKALKK